MLSCMTFKNEALRIIYNNNMIIFLYYFKNLFETFKANSMKLYYMTLYNDTN